MRGREEDGVWYAMQPPPPMRIFGEDAGVREGEGTENSVPLFIYFLLLLLEYLLS